MQNQVRLVAGLNGATMIGFDMGVAFQMAEALQVDPAAVAILFPEIEAAAVAAFHEASRPDDGETGSGEAGL